MDLQEALELSRALGDDPVTAEHREAIEVLARAVVKSAKDGTRREVGGGSYRLEEVTWPVSPVDDEVNAFACPLQKVSLLRGDAVLVDVRSDYWDGRAGYPIVGEKIGRWRRFRVGSPGDRGWDLHLATVEELRAFAAEAETVLRAFGILGAEATAPAE